MFCNFPFSCSGSVCSLSLGVTWDFFLIKNGGEKFPSVFLQLCLCQQVVYRGVNLKKKKKKAVAFNYPSWYSALQSQCTC